MERRILISKNSKSLHNYCQEHPDKLYLLEEWVYEKNKEIDLTPESVTKGGKDKPWWKCPICGGEWQAQVFERAMRGTGCPYCAHQKLLKGFNDLATQYPELAAEWHPTKNGALKPSDVLAGGHKEYWWQCKFGHEFKTSVYNRIRTCACPECSLKGTSVPELALYFYLLKIYSDTLHRHRINNIELDIFIPSLNLGIEYDCSYFHKSKIDVENKKDQFCKNNKIRLIRLRSEKLTQTESAETIWVNENNYNKISEGIRDLFNYLNLEYNFEINIDKDYSKLIETKFLEIKENSLAIKYPELAKEWHPTKNGKLTPDKITFGSSIKVWWQCSKNPKHEWQAAIPSRIDGNGCPYCSNRKILVGDNDLATTHKELCKEWDYEKNYPLTPKDIIAGTSRKVNWICPICNHEYQATVKNRTALNSGCPKCNRAPVWTEEEIYILKEYFSTEGSEIIKRLPNRTIHGIKFKARELNLKNPRNWNKEEIETLRKYYPIEGKNVIKRLPNRNHKAIQIKVSRLGIKYKGDL